MITCTRRIQFCAGHRVYGHESKCANLHGHNYVGLFTAIAPELDSIGRIIDFSVLKEKIGGWIDQYWDHSTLIYCGDPQRDAAAQLMTNKDLFVCEFNPTAENMAKFLLNTICPSVLFHTGVTVSKIVLWETENCYAEVTL